MLMIGNTGCIVALNTIIFIFCLIAAIFSPGDKGIMWWAALFFGALALVCEIWRRSRLAQAKKVVQEAFQAGVNAALASESRHAETPPLSSTVPPTPGDDLIARLERLSDLKAQGSLTEDEFAFLKARLLGQQGRSASKPPAFQKMEAEDALLWKTVNEEIKAAFRKKAEEEILKEKKPRQST